MWSSSLSSLLLRSSVIDEELIPSLDDYEDGALTLSYDASEKSIEQAIRDAGHNPNLFNLGPTTIRTTENSRGITRTVTTKLIPRFAPPEPVQHPCPPAHPLSADRILERIVVVSDQQCPYHDEFAHEAVCNFLQKNKPTALVNNGDTANFDALSRWDSKPRMPETVNSCLAATVQVLSDYKSSVPTDCDLYYLPGNHENHFERYLISHAPEFQGLRIGGTDPEPILTFPKLARLDQLGYRFVTGIYTDWPEATLWLTPHFAIRHGDSSRKGSGNSVRQQVEHMGCSLVVGHVHRAAIVPVYKPGLHRVLWGVEGGTLAKIKGGLGYGGADPDWQNAFVGLTCYDDGYIQPDLIYYDPETRKLRYGNWS